MLVKNVKSPFCSKGHTYEFWRSNCPKVMWPNGLSTLLFFSYLCHYLTSDIWDLFYTLNPLLCLKILIWRLLSCFFLPQKSLLSLPFPPHRYSFFFSWANSSSLLSLYQTYSVSCFFLPSFCLSLFQSHRFCLFPHPAEGGLSSLCL